MQQKKKFYHSKYSQFSSNVSTMYIMCKLTHHFFNWFKCTLKHEDRFKHKMYGKYLILLDVKSQSGIFTTNNLRDR